MTSGAEFIALLEELSRELESGGPTVDDFLLRWAAVLPGEGPGEPGWPGLARQVVAALAAEPTGGAEAAEGKFDEPEVHTRDQLGALLTALAADFVRDRREVAAVVALKGPWWGDTGDWAHGTLSAVLESWAAWLDAVLGRPRPFGGGDLEPVTWGSVAEQLLAARVYE
ncbi:hypothetical protein ASE03_30160 [Kitasatospora sp. Root187]|nr:hypothetical protein ASC99_30375 [Kitasatospora sp. Root107]KRB68204.1 hypothetical protein ASE03_30160 [Kitasatospora sp. Root187]